MQNPARIRFVSLTFLLGFGVGIFAGVALALAAFAMVREPEDDDGLAFLAPTETAEPGATATPTPETRPRSTSALEVRLGPGLAFAVIGTLDRGQALDVVGRDSQGSWLAIRFPPNSSARGWIPAESVEGVPDLQVLAVTAPTPLPVSVVIPTAPPASQSSAPINGAPAGQAPSIPGVPPTPAATATPAPTQEAGPPDLAVTRIALLRDGRVSVTVGNRGPGDLVGQSVFVSIRDHSTRGETLISPQRSLPVGVTITLESTVYRVEEELDVIAVVDPFTAVQDANRANNSLSATLSPLPTPTPTPGANSIE